MNYSKIIVPSLLILVIFGIFLFLDYFSVLPLGIFNNNIPTYLLLTQKVASSESNLSVNVNAEIKKITPHKEQIMSQDNNLGFLSVEKRVNGKVILTDYNGQYYQVDVTGQINNISADYKAKKIISNDGSLNASITEPVLIGEEPGVLSSDVLVTDDSEKTILKITASKYGEEYVNIEPLAFSLDSQWIYLQVWAPRGGDISDKMMVVKQAVNKELKEIIFQNPDPSSTDSSDQVYYSVSHLDKINDRIMVSKYFMENNYMTEAEWWQIDLDSGELKKLYGPLENFSVAVLNKNNTKFITQKENKLVVVDLLSKTDKKLNLALPEKCNIISVNEDINFVALSCYEGNIEYLKLMNLKNGKLDEIAVNTLEDARYELGAETKIFINFAN